MRKVLFIILPVVALALGASGGWYFDYPTNPEQIILCKETCDAVSLPGTMLEYSIGCDRVTVR